MRRVVSLVVDRCLECGRPEGGFARIRCPSCRGEHLLAFSCRTRNFCPSCQAKRGALCGERLIEEVHDDAPHRHVTSTIPRERPGLFERERTLLRIFEVVPLLCPQCHVEMQIASVIQEVTVVERLLTRMR